MDRVHDGIDGIERHGERPCRRSRLHGRPQVLGPLHCPGATGDGVMATKLEVSARRRFQLAICIILWFASSAVCTACAKLTLSLLAPRAGSCALTVTTLQFFIASSAATAACVIFNRRPPSALRELLRVALAYTLGFLLLNQSLGRLQASFTETVRGLEPLTSFAFAWLLGARGSQLQTASAAALCTVLAGAALSVWAQPAFDPGGLLFGLLANCAFSSRALLVTTLQVSPLPHTSPHTPTRTSPPLPASPTFHGLRRPSLRS